MGSEVIKPEARSGFRLQTFDFAVFFLALLLRLIYVWQIAGTPFFKSPILDANVYDQRAWQIAQGDWIGHEVFFQAPLYSYFLGLIYAIFGHNYLVPRLIQTLLGSLSAWMVYRLGSRVFDRNVGFLAGLIFAVYGPLIYFSGELLTPTLEIFLLLTFLLKFDHLLDRPTSWNFLFAGILLGLAAVTRPNVLIFLPGALLWIILRLRDRGRSLLGFVLGMVLIILPVTLRNYWVGRDLVLISSQAGVNFYMGNNRWSNGHAAWVPGTPEDWWAEGYAATIHIAENAAGKTLKPSQVSAFWWKKGWGEISHYPGTRAGLMLKKVRLLFAGIEISNTGDIYYQRKFSSLLSLLLWMKGLFFPFGLILPLALLGLALRFDWKRQSHLIIFQLSYALSIILFFICARYRLPLVPILAIWSAVGVVQTARLIRQKQLARYTLVLLGFFLLLVAVNRNPVKGKMIPGFDGAVNVGNKYFELGQYVKAIPAFEDAIALDSMSSRPVNGEAMALLNLGKIGEAKQKFERALLLEPSLNQARNNLAHILLQEGDLDGAGKNFAKVLELDSSNVFAQQGFADVALEQGDYELAGQYYEKAYSQGALNRQVISRWALALLQQQKYARALEVNGKLLALEPDNARAHHNQARIYIACDSLQQAKKELEIVLSLTPDNEEAQAQLDQILTAPRQHR